MNKYLLSVLPMISGKVLAASTPAAIPTLTTAASANYVYSGGYGQPMSNHMFMDHGFFMSGLRKNFQGRI